MKELIIPLFGHISVGTVQKLYNKSRPSSPPPGVTDVLRGGCSQKVAAVVPCALATDDPRGDFVCLAGQPLAKALTLS